MDKSELEKLIEQKLSQREIAEKFSCSQSTIKYWLKKFNLKSCAISGPKGANGEPKKAQINTVDWDFIQKEYDSGLSYRDLWLKYGISQLTTSQAKKKGLLKTRSIKEAFRIFIDNLSEEEKFEHFSHKGNPNGKMGGYREKAGRSKKYHVKDSFGNIVCLQSSYEKETAEILNELKIKWIRPQYLKYDNKKYFPDFYLVDLDIYLDPKNDHLAKIDEDKIKKVCEQNQVTVLILTKDKINKEFLNVL
jgi:transcriptional regulator with XRE-family HTH domain